MTFEELERLTALVSALDRSRAGDTIDTRTAIDAYLLDCRAARLAATTVKWYASLLKPFCDKFGGRVITSITAAELREYIVTLTERSSRYTGAPQRRTTTGPLSERTIDGHTRALRAFWNWVAREYSIRNPMQNIRSRPQRNNIPKAISASDFRALFDSTGDDATGFRNRAILGTLADTGIRLGGLCSLTIDNLNLADRTAYVTEKGEKTRAVVYTHYTRALIAQWLVWRDVDPTERHVFTSFNTGQGLTASGVAQLLNRLKARAGVEGRVNPHSFRHAFAREYLAAGGDAIRLARLIGHSSASTTAAFYAIFSVQELADMHERLSPLNRLMKERN